MIESIWPCPFCSLLCDEHLAEDLQGKIPSIETFECDKSKDSLSQFINKAQNTPNTPKPILNGKIIAPNTYLIHSKP